MVCPMAVLLFRIWLGKKTQTVEEMGALFGRESKDEDMKLNWAEGINKPNVKLAPMEIDYGKL